MRVAAFSRRVPAAAILGALILGHNVWWDRRFHVLENGAGEATYVEAAEWAKAHLPRDAAIVAMQVSGSFFYYTDFALVRWDFIDGEGIRRVEREAAAGRQPLYAVLFPYEITDWKAFARLPGTWVQVGAIKHITVWQFKGAPEQVSRR